MPLRRPAEAVLGRGLRFRLLLLLVVAAVPVVALSGALAWQTYELQRDQPLGAARLAREGAAASHLAALDSVKQSLWGVAGELVALASLSRDAASCRSTADSALARSSGQYRTVAVANADGTIRCATSEAVFGAPIGQARFFQAMRASDAPVVAPVATDVLGPGRSVVVGVPLPGSGGFSGAILASVHPDWLRRVTAPARRMEDLSLWLFDSARPNTAEITTDPQMPSDPVLAALSAADRNAVTGWSRSGALFAYASEELPDGMLLVAGVPAGPAAAQASADLLRRFIELTIVLALGFVAMALGANRVLVKPIRDLTEAVCRWRDGEVFTPATAPDTPTEVAELSRCFDEASRKLARREADLRAAVEQRELVMQEIHHRVKNNLQIVASLLNLQSGRIRAPAARAEFESARDRVRALAILHRHLYLHSDVQRINMRDFLEELCSQLAQAMSDTDPHRVRLEIDAPELVLDSDQAVPLSLIVTEAVSNSIKYAFPDGRRGRVAVHLWADESTVHLEIEDNGVGIEPGVVQTEAGPRDGLGVQLIRGFARQLGGTLTIRQEDGTRYVLTFPREPAEARPPPGSPALGSEGDVVEQAH